jgi:hypothetical protein
MEQANMALPEDYYGSIPSEGVVFPARAEDVISTESIIAAMYESISGPAGVARDWERMRSLCVRENRSIRTGRLPDGRVACKIMSSDDYIRQIEPWLMQNGFFEKEIHRIEERFGNIAHVLSIYESRRHFSDPHPFMRGINSFQLLFDGNRWWILNVMWQHESAEFPIPQRYLQRTTGV